MGLVQLKENEGNYNDAVSLLVDNDKRYEALECAQRYEDEGQMLREDLLASTLAIRYAKICEQCLPSLKSRNQLVKIVKFMADPMDRVYYLKVAKKHREAFNILCNERKFDEACRMCAAQGWVDEGLKLAENNRNEKWTLQFIFQKAITSLAQDGKIDSNTITKLKSLISKNSTGDQVRANACLLVGKCDHDFFLCRRAFALYLSTQNVAGSLEAFNLMSQFCIKGSKSATITIKQILDACNTAADASLLLKNVIDKSLLTAAQEYKLPLLEEFYGLQRYCGDKSTYYLPCRQQIWVELYDEHGALDTDSDGMIKIDSTKVMKIISSHVQGFRKRWIENDELQVCQLFHSCLSSFQFHKQLEDKGCVKRSFKMNYQGGALYNYLKLCCSGFDISEFGTGEIQRSYVVRLLTNFFRPAATLYLGVTRGQMDWIAQSSSASLLEKHSLEIVQKSDRDFHVDNWLEAWAILSILKKDHLLRQLNKCTDHVRKLSKDKIPGIYRYDKNEGTYVHVFSMWIRSCFLIQKDKRVIASSKVTLHYFLEVIASQRSILPTFSISSIVNILTIHTTALLLLTALCNFIQHKPSNVLMPNSFERVLNVFDNIGKQSLGDGCARVLDACINDEKVVKAYEKMKVNQYAIQNIQKEITKLLWQILDMLLGRYLQCFHPLADAMKTEACIKRGESRHCLLLTLVLFGNLTQIDEHCSQSVLQMYHSYINNMFKDLKDITDEECQILRKTYAMFSMSSNTTGFFLAINHLINTADCHDYIARVGVKSRPSWRYDLERAQMGHLPARPLLPTKTQVAQLQSQENYAVPGRNDEPDTFDRISQQFPLQKFSRTIDHTTSSQQQRDVTLVPALPSHADSLPLTSSVVSDKTSTKISGNEGSGSQPTSPLSTGATQAFQASVETRAESFADMDDELINLELSAPFVVERQTSVTLPEESNSTIAMDMSMLDEKLCRFCGIPLTSEDAAEPLFEHDEVITGDQQETSRTDEQTPDDQLVAENYESHRNSEKHANNVRAYSNFISLKRICYEPLREMLHQVLQQLKRFEEQNVTSNLRTVVLDIEKELEINEEALKPLMYGAKWNQGASLIECDMVERMDNLITAAQEKLSKEQARVKEQHLREQAASTDRLDGDNDDFSGDSDGSQSEEEISKNVDREAAKEKEKQRKRANKKARKQRRKQ